MGRPDVPVHGDQALVEDYRIGGSSGGRSPAGGSQHPAEAYETLWRRVGGGRTSWRDRERAVQPTPICGVVSVISTPMYAHISAPGLLVDNLVLPQATSSTPTTTLAAIGDQAGGIVLTSRAGIHKARELRAAGFAGSLVIDLIDVDRHGTLDGQARRRAAWCSLSEIDDIQVVIAPSRRIPSGDTSALDAQLDETSELLANARSHEAGARVPGLALDSRWLSQDAHLEELVSRLRDWGQLVAIAFADPYDAVGSRVRVRNLRRLVATVDVALVRSDLAGIGAWSYGARFASVGLSSTVRHIPVPLTGPPRTQRDLTPHVLVPGCLGWVKGSALYFAGDHPALRCSCDVCQHRPLARLGDESPQRVQEALLHSFYVWNQIAADLRGARSEERAFAWHRICKRALDMEEQLAEELEISFRLRWQPLRSWVWL